MDRSKWTTLTHTPGTKHLIGEDPELAAMMKAPLTPRRNPEEREFFIDNLLVRIHLIIVMIRWSGLAPREFEFPFPGSLTSTFLAGTKHLIGEDPELAAMMKAPLIHLADSTDDCAKTVEYEACIPALFGQGCTRYIYNI